MSHARLTLGLRRGLPSGIAALVMLVALAGCDGGPTDADDDAPVVLDIHESSVPPFGMLYVGIDDFDVPTSGVPGHIGAAAVTAYPTDEPGEMAILVPQLSPGSYELTLEWGGRVARGQITVTAGAAPADATAYVASSFDETLAIIAEQQAMYADTALRPVAVDSVAFRTSLESVRTVVEQAQTEFAALSPAEQAEVAAFIAAHPEIYAPLDAPEFAAAAAFSMAAQANPFCANDERWFDCVFRNIEIIRNLAATYIGAAVVVNTVSWFFTPAGKVAAKLGTAAGAAAVLTYAGMTINDYLIQENFVDLQVPEGPLEFYANRPRVLEITGRYRSLTTADLQGSSYPAAASVGAAFASLAADWNRLQAALPLITINAPRPPAEPLRSALRRVPGNELAVAEVLTQGVGATWENTPTFDWLVTFQTTSASDLPLVFRVTRNTPAFPSAPITVNADLQVIPDSLAFYEEALPGWWTMNYEVHTYDLELLEGGIGYYHVTEEDIGSKPGKYDMRWSVRYDDVAQRYYFVDSGFFNGWSPVSALSAPLTSMTDTTGAVTYQR